MSQVEMNVNNLPEYYVGVKSEYLNQKKKVEKTEVVVPENVPLATADEQIESVGENKAEEGTANNESIQASSQNNSNSKSFKKRPRDQVNHIN